MDVRLERVSKSFGTNRVVKSVDLTLPDKQFVTLLGPSGCGKTTLLRMIAGLERVSEGTIWFGEQRMNNVPPGRRDVAMVFQTYALYPHMSVFGNIAYGLRVRGTAKDAIAARVREVARVLEIEHLLERKPRQLSGGQRQRVALGRAMVRDPDVFLMDEPLSNLDAKLRVTMRAELKRFHLELRTTTVYVTHDQLEAMTMSDRIAVMSDGIVQQYGTPYEIYNRPANLFVAGFIGNPPMNLIEGRLARDGVPRFVFSGGSLDLPPRLVDSVAPLRDGSALVLGARPQDIALGPPEGAPIQARVWLVELIGSEKLVDIAYGEKGRLIVQVPADLAVEREAAVGLRPNLDKLHLFDPASGSALFKP